MRERVLITGAEDFLGFHLVQEALKNDLDVYAAVNKRSDTQHLKNLNIQTVHLKYNDITLLTKELEENKINYIIHAAGVSIYGSKKRFALVNTLFSFNLASAAADCGVKKFIFISSLSALGPLKNLNGLITESTPPAPVSPYGKSKLRAEQKISELSSLNYTILRPSIVYGPGETELFIFIKQVVKGLEAYIGNIKQKQSFVYINDLMEVTVRALFTAETGVYNISDGNFYSRYEVADNIKEILSSRSVKFHLPVIFVKIIAGLRQKVSSLRGSKTALNAGRIAELTAVNWSCSIEKAQTELGFYPRFNLNRGLTETLAWYKHNNWL